MQAEQRQGQLKKREVESTMALQGWQLETRICAARGFAVASIFLGGSVKGRAITIVLSAAAMMIASSDALAAWKVLQPFANSETVIQTARACRRDEMSPFGPVARIRFEVFRKNANVVSIRELTTRFVNGEAVQHVNFGFNNLWIFGVASSTEGAVASRLADDRIQFEVNMKDGFVDPVTNRRVGMYVWSDVRWAEIPRC